MTRLVEQVINAVLNGFVPDPGTSDLDNEQPITVTMKLGDYRAAAAVRSTERPRHMRTRHASREEQHARYLDCGPQNWDDRD